MLRFAMLALPLVCVFTLELFSSEVISAEHRSLLQICVFPFVLLALSQVFRGLWRVPLAVFSLSFFFAGTGALYAYVYPLQLRSGGVVIARLEHDELENETRIFREAINRTLKRISAYRALNIPDSFADLKVAQEFMTQNSHLRMLVSGNKKWINVSTGVQSGKTLQDMGLRIMLPPLPELKLHTNVSYYGMSYDPVSATSSFLAAMIAAQLEFDKRFESNRYELALLQASRTEAFWTSFAHRAYPFWLLGNHYLERAVRARNVQKRSLVCAIKAYKEATRYLRRGDNPALEASIYNNLGLVHALRGYLVGKKKEIKKADKLMGLAAKTSGTNGKIPANFSAVSVALENLSLLAKNNLSGAKKKRKKLRHGKKKKNRPEVKKGKNKDAGAAKKKRRKRGLI